MDEPIFLYIDYPELGTFSGTKMDIERQALTPIEEEAKGFISTTTQTRCLSPKSWLKMIETPTASPRRRSGSKSSKPCHERLLLISLVISLLVIGVLAIIISMLLTFGKPQQPQPHIDPKSRSNEGQQIILKEVEEPEIETSTR